MQVTRRGFLKGILVAGVAPLIIPNGIARGIIMPVREIIIPEPVVHCVPSNGLSGLWEVIRVCDGNRLQVKYLGSQEVIEKTIDIRADPAFRSGDRIVYASRPIREEK